MAKSKRVGVFPALSRIVNHQKMSIETKVAKINALQAVAVALISAMAVIIPIWLSQKGNDHKPAPPPKKDSIAVVQPAKTTNESEETVLKTQPTQPVKTVNTPVTVSKENPKVLEMLKTATELSQRLKVLQSQWEDERSKATEDEKYTWDDKLIQIKGTIRKLNVDIQTLETSKRKPQTAALDKILTPVNTSLTQTAQQLNSW
jgi:hypothetical protein